MASNIGAREYRRWGCIRSRLLNQTLLVTSCQRSDHFLCTLQGSSYRGDCIPQEEGGGCALIGRAIRAHINGNALYHVGDPSFLDFVGEVSEGEWKHWPFDLAMLKEVQESWPETRFRQSVHLMQLVDWIRNYGPYPVSARL